MGEPPPEKGSESHAGDYRGGLTSRAVRGVTCEEFGVLRGCACQEADSTAGESSPGIFPIPDKRARKRHN